MNCSISTNKTSTKISFLHEIWLYCVLINIAIGRGAKAREKLRQKSNQCHQFNLYTTVSHNIQLQFEKKKQFFFQCNEFKSFFFQCFFSKRKLQTFICISFTRAILLKMNSILIVSAKQCLMKFSVLFNLKVCFSYKKNVKSEQQKKTKQFIVS